MTSYGYDALSNRLETMTSPTATRIRDYSESGATVSQADGATGTVLQTATYDASDRLVQLRNAAGPLGRYLHNAPPYRLRPEAEAVDTGLFVSRPAHAGSRFARPATGRGASGWRNGWTA